MVCILPTGSHAPTEKWMQAVAADVNLSETTFLLPLGEDVDGDYNIRWFTPRAEVDLCGHATLAASHALKECSLMHSDSVLFSCKSGMLPVLRDRQTGMYWLDFPLCGVQDVPEKKDLLAQLYSALCIPADGVAGQNLTKSVSDDFVVILSSEDAVRDLQPDFRKLTALPAHRGLIVTAEPRRGSEHDFVSRFFAPAVGIDEDPVTGSAHCALAPLWAARLGKNSVVGLQCSAREGKVECRVEANRVHIGGNAVTLFSGSIEVPAPV